METPLAVSFNDIPTQPVCPLWPGWVPRRHVTLLVAPGGTGKGLLSIFMTAVVSNGEAWPGEPEGTTHRPANVIIVAPEDDPNEVVAWRLGSANAANCRVFNLTVLPDGSPFQLPRSLPHLRAAMKQIEEDTGDPVDLVILDPLLAMLDKTASIATNARAREVTAPLEKLAQDSSEGGTKPGCAIVLTHHTVKSGKTAGSKGLTDSVRLVLRIEQPDTRTALTSRVRELSVEKSNNGSTLGTLRYVLLGEGTDIRLGFPPASDESDTRGYVIERHHGAAEPEHDVRLLHTVAGGHPEIAGQFSFTADAEGAAVQIIGYPLDWKRGSMKGMRQAAGVKDDVAHTFTVMDLTEASGRAA